MYRPAVCVFLTFRGVFLCVLFCFMVTGALFSSVLLGLSSLSIFSQESFFIFTAPIYWCH